MVDKLEIKLNISGDYKTTTPMLFAPGMSDPALNKYREIYFNPTIRMTNSLLRKARLTSDPRLAFSDTSEYLKLMKYAAGNKRVKKLSLAQAKKDGIIDANIEYIKNLYFKRRDSFYIQGRAYVISTSSYEKGSFSGDNRLYKVTFDISVIDGKKKPGTIDFARADCRTRGKLLREQFLILTGIDAALLVGEAEEDSANNPQAPVMYSSGPTGYTTGPGPKRLALPMARGFPMPHGQNPFATQAYIPQAYPAQSSAFGQQQPTTFGQQPTTFGQQPTTFGQQPTTFGQQPNAFGQPYSAFGQPVAQNRAVSAPPKFSLGGSRRRKGGLAEDPDNADQYWLVTNNRASVDQFITDEQRPMDMRDFAMTRVMRSDEFDGGFWFVQWSRTRDVSQYGHYHLSFIDEEVMEYEEFPPDTDVINVNEDGGNIKKGTKRHKKKRKQTRKPKKKGKGRTRRRKSRRS